MNLPEGVELDPEAHRFAVLGVVMPVGHCFHRLAEPARGDTFGLKYKRPQEAQPESVALNVLCGENGWWVEVTIWPEENAMICVRPDQHGGEGMDDLDALAVLVKWKETCERTDHPRDAGVDEEADAFGGMEPGTWIWDTGERHVYSPEEEAELRKWFKQQFPAMYVDEEVP